MNFFEGLPSPGEDRPGKHQRPGDAAETQISSAMEIQPASGRERIRVLNVIAATEGRGATDEEIQILLQMNPSTERPRRVELVEKGWVEKTELRRRTRSGRSAVVWRLTPAAWHVLHQVRSQP
jgi:hypothetical protein